MEKSDLRIDVKEDDNGKRNSQATSLQERLFLITSFILELFSAVFDQLSSVHRPQCALLNMLISFAVMIIAILDLVYKARKAKVKWMKKELIPWFYYPHLNSKRFGKLVDVIGLVCAIFQWIFASTSYVFLSRHINNPIKVSIWPIIFAFCIILHFRISETYSQKKSASRLKKLKIAQEFTLDELAAATNDFSDHNWIGNRRLSILYRGILVDGSEVIISRRVIGEGDELKEEERTYESALAFMSRLHHRNLAGLIGYCEEGNERLLAFDFCKNGTLYIQLFLKDSSAIDSWVIRIKIALDAARGIDYLHNYAVPPIIHRAIKSSCIELTQNWTARVTDFRLAVVDTESDQGNESKTLAIENDGYLDPEYYVFHILAKKSDVYSFGVVLLELLTGKKAIFNDGDNEDKPTRLVDFVVPKILQNELFQVLDHRVGPPVSENETEAVEMVAYTALQCVNPEGNNRPAIKDAVISLEQALSLLD